VCPISTQRLNQNPMNPILKNILVVIAGIIIGGGLNSLLVMKASSIIPFPEGVDTSDPNKIIDYMHLFEPRNFIMPFLAHALGTMLASYVIARFAASQNFRLALIPGFFFLIGGIIMTRMVDAPTWFDALDLLVAYLPMAYIGYMLGRKK